jgi:F-type H+-transporting ATPase subunit alpha
VAQVLTVQSGLLDPLPLTAVVAFRQDLSETLDREIPDIVHQITNTRAIDDAGKRALREALRKYVQTLTAPPEVPKMAERHD